MQWFQVTHWLPFVSKPLCDSILYNETGNQILNASNNCNKEAYSEHCETSKMEQFVKIVNKL